MHLEQPNESLLVLLYTTSSGRQHTAHLTKTQIKEFIQRFLNNQNYVVTNFNETYGFNPNLISDFKVLDLYHKDVKIDHTEQVEAISDALSTTDSKDNKQLEEAYKDKLDLFKIDCVCGATYVVQISTETSRGHCNSCKEKLYVDRSKGRVDTYKGLAWLMTNRYFISNKSNSQHI